MKQEKGWDDIFLTALRRGDDHGYAAYLADRHVERKKRQSRKEAGAADKALVPPQGNGR